MNLLHAGCITLAVVMTLRPEQAGTFSCKAGEIMQERAGLLVCVPSGIPPLAALRVHYDRIRPDWRTK